MGKSWVRTEDQDTYLKGQYQPFLTARANETLEQFRAELYEGWFNQWPETFPGWKPGDTIGPEDLTKLGEAIAKRKNVSLIYCL